jgi:hypothetical protein
LTQTTRGTKNESDGGFMGYYVQSSYEILSITDNRMTVLLQANNTGLAWYMIFTTTKPTQAVADYTTLKFSDEFNTDGAPDPAKWSYDLGTGSGS